MRTPLPDKSLHPYSDSFQTCVTLPATTGTYVVAARARVDSDWATQHNPGPKMPPQSHIVNARTNPNW